MTTAADPSQSASELRARRRRTARLSAVQALYQMELTGAGAKAVVLQFRNHHFGYDDEPGDYIEADEDFFEDLLTGIVSRQDEVDSLAASVVKEGWKYSRLDATVRAILRAGGYELLAREDVPVGVIINEYVDIAKAFFEGPEPGLINATLDALARKVRSAAPSRDG
jgi:N utilization substance protein B